MSIGDTHPVAPKMLHISIDKFLIMFKELVNKGPDGVQLIFKVSAADADYGPDAFEVLVKYC